MGGGWRDGWMCEYRVGLWVVPASQPYAPLAQKPSMALPVGAATDLKRASARVTTSGGILWQSGCSQCSRSSHV